MNNLEYTEFHGYSRFTDVINPTVRAWNRANTIYNIKERHGEGVASKYVKGFPKPDQVAIFTTMLTVNKFGYEEVRRTIMRETPIDEPLNA